MIEVLRTYVKTLLEQERSEEQEIKELFQCWINEYSASYITYRKNINPDSWDVTRLFIQEHEERNYITISPNFKEDMGNDWFIIACDRDDKDKNIYCANTQVLISRGLDGDVFIPPTSALAIAFDYVEYEWMSKISINQFRRVMDVTKGNYAQFDALTRKFGEMNDANA